MSLFGDRQLAGRLIISVLTEQLNVREAIKQFPETTDKSIECAYHALVHFEADEYKPYYKGISRLWQDGFDGFWKEFKRFINI